MTEKRSKISLAVLVLLLVVAVVNFTVVHYAYNSPSLSVDGGTVRPAASGYSTVTTAPPPAPPAFTFIPRGPELRGEVSVEKQDSGKYDITIFARNRDGHPVVLDGFSADVHLLSAPETKVIPVFQKAGDGKYAATVAFPEKGRWEVRVRLHRKNEVLEFYQSFDIF